MRLNYPLTAAIIGVLFVTAPARSAAEVITYKFEGTMTGGFSYLGPVGSDVVGYFSYEETLPIQISLDYLTSYGLRSLTIPPDIYFQIHGEDHSIFSTRSYSNYTVYNDYGIDNPNIITFDGIYLLGLRLSDETGFNLPAGLQMGVMLRDNDHTLFDSTDMPVELPPMSEFEIAVFLTSTGPFADVASYTRINNGDLNGDGFVGIDDLNLVLTHWNQDVLLGDRLSGNTNNDSFVGIDDLNTVLGNWNAGSPPNSTANIPESATLTLLTLGVMSMNRRRSR